MCTIEIKHSKKSKDCFFKSIYYIITYQTKYYKQISHRKFERIALSKVGKLAAKCKMHDFKASKTNPTKSAAAAQSQIYILQISSKNYKVSDLYSKNIFKTLKS